MLDFLSSVDGSASSLDPDEERRAEIVGAGLAGLLAACALAQRDWKVRVHERSQELRMFGAGIWLWENGLTALQAIGALDEAIARGQQISAWEIRDRHGHLIRRRQALPWDRLIVPPRADLYEALKRVARDDGVEVVTGSKAISADPSGEVVLADGSRLTADLVVAADGLRSAIRESLHLTKSFRPSATARSGCSSPAERTRRRTSPPSTGTGTAFSSTTRARPSTCTCAS